MASKSKICLYVILLFVVIAAGIYVWKLISENNLRRKMESERITLVERSQEFLDRKTNDLLDLMTIPFVWTVRREMLRDNYDQINEYLAQFVKKPNIKGIVVVKDNGKISAATDKKQEEKDFSLYYPTEYLTGKDINIVKDKDEYIYIIAPIMGLNTRIGTLLIIFIPEKFVL